ncbi:MAG: Asp-tRNA(Asn)/Glu-tRNA(Gln) amidotransferase GatCAB subunit B [Bdellovibrionaceae bacterium]|nr:Asp-tRNA(Asn)/Glu-tRNA(Gln) amidotransferase GatCAB subunit B [Pseudobdellovibrionaceae bacterium]
MSYDDWELVCGLEIHAQLKTKSKMFSPDSGDFGAGDNVNTHPVTLGMPGCLPVPNKQAIEYSVKTGLALNCTIRNTSVFSRKNYYYPDLPKGYQISQFDKPLCEEGFVEFKLGDEKKRVRIERAHMEEDAGKSTHHGEYTLINLNRAGVPLLEIVSRPDIRSAEEAAEYARAVRKILRYIEVCDGNLEEGSMRCDCNVSVRKKGDEKLGTRCEIKNVNSFRFVQKAIEYETQRQIDVLESGGKIVQQTRLYDSAANKTFAMRDKEDAHDYRYFPEPDMLPVELTEEYISKVESTLCELPDARVKRFMAEYELPEYDSLILTQERDLADYYEAVAKASNNPKASSNWIMGELLRELNEHELDYSAIPIKAENFAKLIQLIDNKTISGKIAKTVFQELWKKDQDPEDIVKAKGLVQITDEGAIEKVIDEIINANPGQVEQYRGGKNKLFGFFVGQAMKATKGQANPEIVNKILKSKLDG